MTKQPNKLTWVQIADEVGVSLNTLHKWRKHDDAPKVRELQPWLDYSTTIQPRGRPRGIAPKEINHLRERLLEEQGRKEAALASLRELELKMKVESLVPESDLMTRLKDVLIPLRRLLDALPRAIAAQANPSKPNVAEMAIRKGLDDRVFSEIERTLKLASEQQDEQ
jgi:transposase-like protein